MILSLANAGTPLMWAGFLHLVFGNLMIGVGEGWLIARAARSSRWAAMVVMILANYLSMFAGVMAVSAVGDYAFQNLPGDSLLALRWIVPSLFAAFFVLTCLIEYPVAIRLRGELTHRQFLWPFVRTQLASNVILVVVFGWASFQTITSNTTVRPRADFLKPLGATMYYVALDQKEVRTRRLDTGEDKPFTVLAEPDRWMDLRRSASGWEIVAGDQPVRTVPFASAERVVPASRTDHRDLFWGSRSAINWGSGGYFGEAYAGTWPAEGLVLWRKPYQHLALETPFLRAHSTHCTILPTRQVVYCLGFRYILLLDLDTMELATLAQGSSPVVVLDAAPGT